MLGTSNHGSSKYRRWRSTDDAHRRFRKSRDRLDLRKVISDSENAPSPTTSSESAKDLRGGNEITIVKKSPSKAIKAIPKFKRVKSALEPELLESITSLPYEEGSFRFIPCSRKKATSIQRHLYSINKDNAAGWTFATRYDYKKVGLLVWRMT